MEQRPESPPEGKLIAAAADRMNLSIREAARRAGISYGRWRQIVTGYQNVSPGSYAEVVAPPRTLAKMAAVVGVTPDEMEAAGRPDAANAMRSSPVPVAAVTASSPEPAPDPNEIPAIEFARAMGVAVDNPADPFLRSVRDDISAAVDGSDATGAEIFHGEPWSADEARIWDVTTSSRRVRELTIAGMRAHRARYEAGREHNRAARGTAGLALAPVTLSAR